MGIFDVPIYVELKKKRIAAIVNHFGKEWFDGKRLLELGCGHADMGNEFHLLGATVTVTDARKKHLEAVKEKYPYLDRVLYDLNSPEWPFRKDYDLILNMGILYHLEKYERFLENCFSSCKNMFLETIVSDSADPAFVKYVDEDGKDEGSDQSFTSRGCRPSWANIEMLIVENHFYFQRHFSKDLNTDDNLFDWEPTGSNECSRMVDEKFFWLRRAWFCSI